MPTSSHTANPRQNFAPLPSWRAPLAGLTWPTPNHSLFENDGVNFFARHRGNADYGKPGWTRDCGRRVHKGMDIAPVHFQVTEKKTSVIYTDCATGRDWEAMETVIEPQDEIFAALYGEVAAVNHEPEASDYGKFVVLRHRIPRGEGGGAAGECVTLYGHLNSLHVAIGQHVRSGATIGVMGKTSRSADARNWMDVTPHLHFEVGQVIDPNWATQPANARAVGGNYNGRNLQPFDPVAFYLHFFPR